MELPFTVQTKNESVDIYAYRSEKIDELIEAKLSFLNQMIPMGNDSSANKSKFASLCSLQSHTKNALIKNDLIVDQIDLPYYYDPSTYNGILYLHTILIHKKSSQWIKSVNPYPLGLLSPEDKKISLTVLSVMEVVKAYGAANTYLRRYSYKSILGIIIDDEYDEDGNDYNKNKKQEYIKKEEVLTPQQVQVFHKEFSGQTHIYEKIFERFKISKIDMVPRDKFNDVYTWAQEQKYK